MSTPPSDYLFVTRSLRPDGGEEALAAWCLQCLLQRGSVSVITYTEPDLARLDEMAGTTLANTSFDLKSPRFPVLEMLWRLGVPTRLLSFRLFLHYVRKLRRRGKPCISIGADLDLGESVGVWQYLASVPRHHTKKLRAANLKSTLSLTRRMLAWMNLVVCDLFIPCRDRRTGEAFTAVVSDWIGKEFSRLYGRPADLILYPPPLGTSNPRVEKSVWGFVSLCRAHPNKGWVEMIAVVKRLRERGHDVSFSMLALGPEKGFITRLRSEVERHSDWLTLEVNAPRNRLDEALRDHAFGLHLSREEGYGMAVAEMLLAGCLTGVRDTGGQREIVTEAELRFRDVEDAVEKWDQILSHPETYRRLQESQQARRELHTRELFQMRFQEALDEFEERLLQTSTAGIHR